MKRIPLLLTLSFISGLCVAYTPQNSMHKHWEEDRKEWDKERSLGSSSATWEELRVRHEGRGILLKPRFRDD